MSDSQNCAINSVLVTCLDVATDGGRTTSSNSVLEGTATLATEQNTEGQSSNGSLNEIDPGTYVPMCHKNHRRDLCVQ